MDEFKLPSLDEFLTGRDDENSGDEADDEDDDECEESSDDSLDIDDIFAKDFSRVRKELLDYDKDSLNPVEDSVITPSVFAEGYTFQEVESGLALISPEGQIVGGYLSCDLSVDDEHQGQGLGAELIIEYFLRNESIPTWDLDIAAYSNAGYAAHQSAWHTMDSDPSMVQRKLRRIDGETVPEPKPGHRP